MIERSGVMSLGERARALVGREPTRVDGSPVADRVAALGRFLDAAADHLPAERLAAARTIVDRAGERLALSRDHTVVALAGATGSGKSSLFNALAKLHLSKVGVRRPTTGVAHACVWGTESAAALLDWLGVPGARRFNRESPLDGEDEAALRGLVLLDLPDFDSVEEAHRLEVDRLLGLVDAVVWVLDPQKYADRAVHQTYLANFTPYRDVTVVVLNQADLLGPEDTERCLVDLQRLLAADGLPEVPVHATSTVGEPGFGGLRRALERAVTARQAALRRLAGDVDVAVAELAPLIDGEAGGIGGAGSTSAGAPAAAEGESLDRASVDALSAAFADAAGVPAVAAAAQQAYAHRASAAVGWPLVRWLRRLRRDPLRRLHLDRGADAPVAATSLPPATPATAATVSLAVRAVGERAAGRLPEAWRTATVAAARALSSEVPDALDSAVARTDLGLRRTPLWWRAVGTVQWLAAVAALVGLGWLAVRYVLFAAGLPALPSPMVGLVPLPTVLLFGGLLAGLLVAVVVAPLVRIGARRARTRADARLRGAVDEVARVYVVEPVRAVLQAYALARVALIAAARGSRR
jgi:hypothetical protein